MTTTQLNRGHGHQIGILLLTDGGPFVPGDVRDAGAYGYPVVFETVPGADPGRVLQGDPDLTPAVIETAQKLERQGVRGISSDCGFFLNYQEAVRNAVGVPVALSALLQLPFIASFLGRDRAIGLITGAAQGMGNRTLALSGVPADRKIVVKGMQDQPEWIRQIKKKEGKPDYARLGKEAVALAKTLRDETPDLGAILVTCSLLPMFSRDIQEATGVPVFDFVNMIDYVQSGAHQRTYAGSHRI